MSAPESVWSYVLAVADVVLAVGVSVHVVLKKRDDRAAVAWLAMVWLSPFVGAGLYWLFGVNRITRRALRLRGRSRDWTIADSPLDDRGGAPADDVFFVNQANLIRRFPHVPGFVGGNRVRLLRSGDAAYPEMLNAIRSATNTIALSTYIFNDDLVGRRFATALGDAVRRGVEVRVLIDGIGALYSIPTVIGRLRRHGIKVARFLAALRPWRMSYINLRNHRKILVVDGRIGFTGGMNVKLGHLLSENPAHPTPDLHFRIDGPVVTDLMAALADDWAYTTGEALSGTGWFPAPLERAGDTLMRGIPSGPNEEIGSLRVTLLGALTQVCQNLRIATPYFLPDEEITSLLVVAALRGVKIDIVVPANSNLFFIKWAETASFHRLISAGCQVWLEAPPFDHAKVAVADGRWVLLGSSNWDNRSFRLNFEFDCECFDTTLAKDVDALIEAKIARSSRVTIESLSRRDLARRLADGVARLFKPFL